MKTNTIKFALLYIDSGRMIKIGTDETRDSNEKSVAKMFLRMALKEENLPFTWGSIQKYLEDYAFCMNEDSFDNKSNHTPESVTSYIADNLVYCNAPHIIRLSNRTEVDHAFKDQVVCEIEKMLDMAAANLKEKR